MQALGLQGSPRKKGNTVYLLDAFMNELRSLGVHTRTVHVADKNIIPCKEYIVCEKKGFCPIQDDMSAEIFSLLRQADLIVAATPIFFYNATAQLKALIDRSQTLWARKYKLKLTDPLRNTRRGYVLALGATRGKNLFEGLNLTVKYFFDAVGAEYAGSLTYRRIENKGDMEKHPTVLADVKEAVRDFVGPLLDRKVVIVAGRTDACRSQMASAFIQYLAGDRFEAFSGGFSPADKIDPLMVEVMQEKGLDMAFRTPRPLQALLAEQKPERIITLDPDASELSAAEARIESWRLADPSGRSIDFYRNLRDDIEKRVQSFIIN